jgi:hypothetical protein
MENVNIVVFFRKGDAKKQGILATVPVKRFIFEIDYISSQNRTKRWNERSNGNL